MKQYINFHYIANVAKMLRSQYIGTLLIIEGDKDSRVYSRFLNSTGCKIIVSFGKDNAVNALNELERDSVKGVLIIVDADFDRLNGFTSHSPNIFITDSHDLETMLIYSSSLDKVLNEFASAAKIKRLGRPIRDILLECALPIGFLRWLSSPQKRNLNLKFKGLRFDKFVNKQTLRLDIDKLIKEVKTNSQAITLDESRIKSDIATELHNLKDDPWQVCSGHDLVQILYIGLLNVLRNKRERKYIRHIDLEIVDRILRLAYEYTDFCLTRLYKAIKAWEQTNPSFKVLAS